MEDPSSKQEISRILNVLEALKQASHDLQLHPTRKPTDSNSSAIKALLELETESDTILCKDPNLVPLSHHLSSLKNLVQESRRCGSSHSLRNFLTRRVSAHSISRVASSIESEIQAWIDRESIESLTKALSKKEEKNEDELVSLLTQFENRVTQGFDRELQDLILKSKILYFLENIICDSDPNWSKRVKEQCGFVVAALIRFNKDVFVGEVQMGPLIHALVSMASWKSIKVLSSLINLIKSPLVDEIESNGELPKIISFLDYKDLQMRILTMECILEIGYFGRKEAIEAMLKEGLIRKLVELQRLDLELIESEKKKKKGLAFAGCVGKFAVQLEVGEGLRQREKRAFKAEILERVKEASDSDAEAATITAEVLWGSSP